MDARYIANMLLALEGNPQVALWRWTDKGSQYYSLNFTCGLDPEGFVCLSTGDCNITNMVKDSEMKESWENSALIIDYKNIVETVLTMKEVLPALMGVDKNFDKLIAEKLKEKDNG